MSPSTPAASALDAIGACGVVAIVRGGFLADIATIVEALIDGGVRAIEVSLTSPEAEAQIERAAATARTRAAIGAGTVLDARGVEAVFQRGASFVVSPVVEPSVIEAALDRSMLAIPGAYTPTEAMTAIRLGAGAVKLFPADTIPPAFLRAMLVPLPGVKLVPTGVTLDRAQEFAAAGAPADLLLNAGSHWKADRARRRRPRRPQPDLARRGSHPCRAERDAAGRVAAAGTPDAAEQAFVAGLLAHRVDARRDH